MWVLLMMVVNPEGMVVNAYPKPFADEATCGQAIVANQTHMEQMLEKAGTKIQFTLKCIQWPAEKAE